MTRKDILDRARTVLPSLPATTMTRVTMWTGEGTCWPNMSPKC